MTRRCEWWWIVTIVTLVGGEDKERTGEQDLTLDIYLIICGPSRNINTSCKHCEKHFNI